MTFAIMSLAKFEKQAVGFFYTDSAYCCFFVYVCVTFPWVLQLGRLSKISLFLAVINSRIYCLVSHSPIYSLGAGQYPYPNYPYLVITECIYGLKKEWLFLIMFHVILLVLCFVPVKLV